jgi:hypothetical protein
MNYLSVETK